MFKSEQIALARRLILLYLLSALMFLASLGWVLFLVSFLTGCGLSSVLKTDPPAPKQLVCGPGPMAPCVIKEWLLPEQLGADQAGELALAARAESKACAKRHLKLIECIQEFQNGR